MERYSRGTSGSPNSHTLMTGRTSSQGRRASASQGTNITFSQYSQLNDSRGSNYLLQFVLPEGHTQSSCSPRLIAAFKLCKDYNLMCEWLEEKYFPDIIPMPGNIFVLDPFEGPAFDHVEEELKKSKNFMVIGPQCLCFSLQRPETESGIINRGYPMYTMGMRNLVISLSGFKNREIKTELANLIRKMGGYPASEFTLATTHVVTDNLLSDKCAFAYKNRMPVMTEEWIKETWKQSLDSIIHAIDEDFLKYECPIFHKLGFCVSQVSATQKAQLKKLILSNGGTYSAELIKDKTHILVVPKGEGDKYKYSVQWLIPCVTPAWVMACKEAGHIVHMEEYRVHPERIPLSSTPTESKCHIPFSDLTSCSVIANATSRPAGFGVDNVSRFANRNYSIVSEATADDFESLRNASIVNPFLDGCKVYLCNPEKAEPVRKLLNGSGATRLNQLTDSVSHVVVMGSHISDREVELIKKLDSRPHIVGFEWLTESAKKGSPADEELFQFIFEEDDIDDNNDGNNSVAINSVALTARQPPTAESLNINRTNMTSIQNLVESISNRTRSSASKNTSLARQKSSDNELEVEVVYIKEKEQDKSSESSSRTTVESQGQSEYSLKSEEADDESQIFIFVGYTFKILLFPLDEVEQIKRMITEMGGTISTDNFEDEDVPLEIIILPAVSKFHQSGVVEKKEFTRYWLEDCLDQGKPDITIELHHVPLKYSKRMSTIFDGVVLAMSSYVNSQKQYIANVAIAIGAKFQDVFARKTDKETGIIQSTHLVCNQTDNDKVRAAVKWNIPVVTKEWIIDSFKAKTKLDCESYNVFNKNDSGLKVDILVATPKHDKRNRSTVPLRTVTSTYPPSVIGKTSTSVGIQKTSMNPPPCSEVRVRKLSLGSPPGTPNSEKLPVGIAARCHTPSQTQSQSLPQSSPEFTNPTARNGDSTLSDSPLFCGLSRASSRQLKNALAKMTGNDKDDPNKTLNEMSVFIPRRNSTPEQTIIGEAFRKLREAYPRPKTPKADYNSLNVVRVPAQDVSIKTPEPLQQLNGISTSAGKKNCQPIQGGGIGIAASTSPNENVATDISVGRKRASESTSGDETDSRDDSSDRGSKCSKAYKRSRTSTSMMKSELGTKSFTNTQEKEEVNGVFPIEIDNFENPVHLDPTSPPGSNRRLTRRSSSTGTLTEAGRSRISREKVRDTGSRMTIRSSATVPTERLESSKGVELPKSGVATGQGVLDGVFVYISKRCQEIFQQLCVTVMTLGAQVLEDLVSARLTHIIFQGKTNHMTKDMRVVLKRNANVHVVSPDWVWTCEEKQMKVPEEDYSYLQYDYRVSLRNLRRSSSVPIDAAKRKTRSTTVPAPATMGARIDKFNNIASGSKVLVGSSRSEIEMDAQERKDKTEIPPAILRSAERKQRERTSTVGWADGRKTKLCLMFTGVTEEDKQRYTKIIHSLGGSVNSSAKFSGNIDGIVAGTLARSEKVLCAIASGKRILRPNYLINSQNSGIFLADPDAFIWGYGDGRNPPEELLAVASAYWYRRISKDPLDKPFSKFNALIFDNIQGKAEAYKNLITAGGGKIYEKADLGSVNIIICDSTEILRKFLGQDNIPKILVKPAICLHEIITKRAPCTDEFFVM